MPSPRSIPLAVPNACMTEPLHDRASFMFIRTRTPGGEFTAELATKKRSALLIDIPRCFVGRSAPVRIQGVLGAFVEMLRGAQPIAAFRRRGTDGGDQAQAVLGGLEDLQALAMGVRQRLDGECRLQAGEGRQVLFNLAGVGIVAGQQDEQSCTVLMQFLIGGEYSHGVSNPANKAWEVCARALAGY